MKYDDASWHSGGDFPASSPDEFGGTHIGLYLRWCFLRGWAGSLHIEECPEDVALVVAGEMSGTDFLFKNCDGKLTDEDLTEQGNLFTAVYQGPDGQYLNDYSQSFGDLLYVSPESAHDFRLFAAMVDDRFNQWSTPSRSTNPWWRIW